MSILTVSVIAVGSAILGFLTAALLAAAKASDRAPTHPRAQDPRMPSDPSQD
jgi:hypothetical protein